MDRLLPCFHSSGKWGYVDPQGQWKICPAFDYAAPFVEGGVASVVCGQKSELRTLIDRDGRSLFGPRPFEELIPLTGERALAQDPKPVVVDSCGREVWRPGCDDLQAAGGGLFIEWFDSWRRARLVREGGIPVVNEEFRELSVYAKEGCLLGRREDGYALMDFKSNILRSYLPHYEEIGPFDEAGRAIVSVSGLRGVMTKAGDFVLSPMFKEIDFCFGGGHTLVSCRSDESGDFKIFDVQSGDFLPGDFECTAPAVDLDLFWGFAKGGWSLYRSDGRCLAHDVCVDLRTAVDGKYQGAVDESGKMFYVFWDDGRLTEIRPKE